VGLELWGSCSEVSECHFISLRDIVSGCLGGGPVVHGNVCRRSGGGWGAMDENDPALLVRKAPAAGYGAVTCPPEWQLRLHSWRCTTGLT